MDLIPGAFLLAGDRGDILIFGLDIEPGPGCIASDFQADGLAVEFNRLDMTFKQRSRLQGLANTEGGGFLEDDRFTGALFFRGGKSPSGECRGGISSSESLA